MNTPTAARRPLPLLAATALLALLAGPARAQQENQFLAEASFIFPEGEAEKAFVLDASRTAIRYKDTPQTTEIKSIRPADVATIWFHEPRALAQAMDLFQARKYRDALPLFTRIRDLYQPVASLPDNPAGIAAFHVLECHRKLGDLEALSSEMTSFNKESLTRPHQLRQIEINLLWDAARTAAWERLEPLASKLLQEKLPGNQLAQAAYLQGLALENLSRKDDALAAYHTALVADLAASEEIGRLAALAILNIHHTDESVAEARKAFGTPAEKKNSPGHLRLIEAGAIARLFELSLGAGTALPAELQEYAQYKPAEPES